MSISIPVSRVVPVLKRATEGQLDKLDPVLLLTSLALLAIGLVFDDGPGEPIFAGDRSP